MGRWAKTGRAWCGKCRRTVPVVLPHDVHTGWHCSVCWTSTPRPGSYWAQGGSH